MGTGFDSWAAFHAVERNKKNAYYTETRAVSKHAFFKVFFGISGPILLQNDSEKIGPREFKKKNVKINIPIYHPKNVFKSEENNKAFWAKCCLCDKDLGGRAAVFHK